MHGLVRVALLDRAYQLGSRLARTTRTAISLAAGQSRWGPGDLYAAWMTARFYAAASLIDQIDPDQDPDTAFAVHTAPWTGTTRIYQEDQR
jgi:hypothetical protein